MKEWHYKSCCVIVAHPDDETIWCGGLMLLHPKCNWKVVCLCRRDDPDRAPKFGQVLGVYNADGVMGDMNDGPELIPLNDDEVRGYVRKLVDGGSFDLIITHGPRGEYTRHIRHEEVSRAVTGMWYEGKLISDELWMFAYGDEDGNKSPRAVRAADVIVPLPDDILAKKHRLITEYYGFSETSFEARAVSSPEAFWRVLRNKH